MEAKTFRSKRRTGLLCAAAVITLSGSAIAQDIARIPVRTNTTATITAQIDNGTAVGNTITANANAVDTLRILMSQLTSIAPRSGLQAQNTPAITYARGSVTLNLPGNPAYRTADISVYSLDGRRVMSTTADAVHRAAGMSRQSLAAGAYLMGIRGADGSQTNSLRFSHSGGKFNVNVAFMDDGKILNLAKAAAAGDITILVQPRAGAVTANYLPRRVTFRPVTGVNPLQVIDMQTPTERMAAVRQAMTNTVPSAATTGNSYGTRVDITYPSVRFGGTQSAIVILPPNYNDGRKFPIMYFGHGIGGGASDNDMSSRQILRYLVEQNQAKNMILVYANQWTPVTQAEVNAGNSMSTGGAYAAFVNDWATNLHPYMLANYPVAPGRENVAITGFSMGGNMAIRTWMAHPDKIGFVGLGDPPGVNTSTANIRGSAAGAANAPKPWLIFLSNAGNNDVVGEMPQGISDALTANSMDHVWHHVPGVGHGSGVMRPHLYNFMRGIF